MLISHSNLFEIDVSTPDHPELLRYHRAAGSAMDLDEADGRVFLADGPGGLAIFEPAQSTEQVFLPSVMKTE
jgi:hypothetical protein